MIKVKADKSRLWTCDVCEANGQPLAQIGSEYDFTPSENPPAICKKCLLKAVRMIEEVETGKVITRQVPLFPVEPNFVVMAGYRGHACPHCGEGNLTTSIYGVVTYLCGYSYRPELSGTEITECEGARYKRYLEPERAK